MPDGPVAQCDLLEEFHDTLTNPIIYMEKVGFHRQGNNASASCTFARHCGHLQGFIICLKMPLVEVTPQKWMTSLGKMPKEMAPRKRYIKNLMGIRFPHLRITLSTADALGIMEYALNKEGIAGY